MSLPNLLVATRNPGKMREYRQLLRDVPFQLVSLQDLGITEEVEETGETFLENARLKARAYASLGGLLTLADDSGLEVDALKGEPGVRSARYGEQPTQPPFDKGGQGGISAAKGEGGRMSDRDRVALLLRNLEGVPWEQRTARFRCVIAIAISRGLLWGKEIPPSPLSKRGSEGDLVSVVGSVAGMIQYEPKGEEGFGYDPVFYLPSYGQTMAQLPLEEKNRISHRADAARRAVAVLKQLSAVGPQPDS